MFIGEKDDSTVFIGKNIGGKKYIYIFIGKNGKKMIQPIEIEVH
jgi:hypothetical protein